MPQKVSLAGGGVRKKNKAKISFPNYLYFQSGNIRDFCWEEIFLVKSLSITYAQQNYGKV